MEDISMTFTIIKREVSALSADLQDELTAFLIHLRHQREPGYAEEMSRRLNDTDPESWTSLSDLKEESDRLSQGNL